MTPVFHNLHLLMELTRNMSMNVERFEAAAYEALVWQANGLPEDAGQVSDLSLRVTPVTLKEGGRPVGIDIALSGKIDGEIATMNASYNFRDGPFWGMRSENLSSERVMVRQPENAGRGVRNVSLTGFEHPAVAGPGRAERGEALAHLFNASCAELVSDVVARNDPFSSAFKDPDPIFRRRGVAEKVMDLLTPSL